MPMGLHGMNRSWVRCPPGQPVAQLDRAVRKCLITKLVANRFWNSVKKNYDHAGEGHDPHL